MVDMIQDKPNRVDSLTVWTMLMGRAPHYPSMLLRGYSENEALEPTSSVNNFIHQVGNQYRTPLNHISNFSWVASCHKSAECTFSELSLNDPHNTGHLKYQVPTSMAYGKENLRLILLNRLKSALACTADVPMMGWRPLFNCSIVPWKFSKADTWNWYGFLTHCRSMCQCCNQVPSCFHLALPFSLSSRRRRECGAWQWIRSPACWSI